MNVAVSLGTWLVVRIGRPAILVAALFLSFAGCDDKAPDAKAGPRRSGAKQQCTMDGSRCAPAGGTLIVNNGVAMCSLGPECELLRAGVYRCCESGRGLSKDRERCIDLVKKRSAVPSTEPHPDLCRSP